MFRKISTLSVLLFLGLMVFGQSSPPQDWFHLDAEEDGYNGVSTNKVYDQLLKGKKSKTVIVAVIDSGIDVEHEDLKDVMWTNPGEIPNNGKDDDGNGYIDDVHGWNFIGGKDGENVGADTYEVTRLFGKYDYKYKDADESKLSKKDKAEYKKYLTYKAEVESKKEGAQKNLDRVADNRTFLAGALAEMKEVIGDMELTAENIEAIDAGESQNLNVGKRILLNTLAEEGSIESIDAVAEGLSKQLDGADKHYNNQLKYAYNPDFNTRTIVGDDYKNPYEKYYGNNDVSAPDAFHGTHVAGIIGATRNNDIGMDGVADNVKIMSVRTVPDGDERDKDVANAIIYAVDNGASIINMSFGKGFSWNKEVVDKAVKYAQKNDVLLVHAAGNGSADNDSSDNFPNDKFEKKGLFCKPNANNWIEVGALNYAQGEDLSAPFSNYGKTQVDLFAPGMKIYSTTPDNNYQNAQGTSMAAPVVAGVAAVIRSHYPTLTAAQVKEVLESSSVPQNVQVKKPGTDEIVPFSELSKSGGVVNLYNAVQKAATMKGKKKMKKSKA